MGNRIQLLRRVIALIGLVMMVNGCASSLVVGSMSAAPSGATYASSLGGKIESYQLVNFEDTVNATRQAAENLSLDLKQETVDADRASFRFMDNGDRRADVVIERRTATMTYLAVNTGWFGAHGMGQLLMKQILDEISDAGNLSE